MNKDQKVKFSSFIKRNKMIPYENKKKPVVFFGLYHVDLRKLDRHKSTLILVWRGTDIILPGHLDAAINSKVDVKHVAISSFIEEDLKARGIRYKFLPLVGGDMKGFASTRLGKEIYVYIPKTRYKFYGGHIVDKLKKKCKYKINISSSCNTYSRKQLHQVYNRCFCGLRLTPHDGVANQVVEMGLMGRKTIFNGVTPSSIPWEDDVDKILESIEKEAEKIGTIQKDLSKKVKDFYIVNDDWLNIEYWEGF
jgi:hypothetical protein